MNDQVILAFETLNLQRLQSFIALKLGQQKFQPLGEDKPVSVPETRLLTPFLIVPVEPRHFRIFTVIRDYRVKIARIAEGLVLFHVAGERLPDENSQRLDMFREPHEILALFWRSDKSFLKCHTIAL